MRCVLILLAMLPLTACRKQSTESAPKMEEVRPAVPHEPATPTVAKPTGATPIPPSETCKPTGTWTLRDERTDASGGLCAAPGFKGGTSTVLANSSGTSVRWSEDGDAHDVALQMGDCGVRVPNKKQRRDAIGDGGSYQLTMEFDRTVRFDATELIGTATATVTTDPAMPGTPCTATYKISGKRL